MRGMATIRFFRIVAGGERATIAFSATLARFSLGGLGDPPYLCHAKALASQPPCAGAVN